MLDLVKALKAKGIRIALLCIHLVVRQTGGQVSIWAMGSAHSGIMILLKRELKHGETIFPAGGLTVAMTTAQAAMHLKSFGIQRQL